MQNFQQQYSRKVITGSFDDLQHIVATPADTITCFRIMAIYLDSV